MADSDVTTEPLKICIKCNEPLPLDGFYKNHRNGKPRARCKPCISKYRSRKKQIRRDPLAHKTLVVRLKRSLRYKRRQEVITGYGGRCACCAESNRGFLTIDHVNNNGSEERATGIAQETLYKRIITAGFPPEYQILCYNCNCGRARFGICPHINVA